MTGLGNIDDVYNHYLKVIRENQQLRALLKECKQHMYFQKEIDNETITLLTRINVAVNESEER